MQEARERYLKDRKKQNRKRQLKIRIGIFAAVLLVGIAFAVAGQNSKREEEKAFKEQQILKQQAEHRAQVEDAKTTLSQLYSETFQQAEASSFSEWVFEQYSVEMRDRLISVAEDGEITLTEFYQSINESIYVATDRYHGFLDDDETAASHQIYLRDGKTGGEAEITIAGDLCFAEDGFVLDHYDTVNDLEQCISPEILKVTNGSDLFYVNHEYCISDRGAPLDGKYYTFRAKPERMELLKQMGTDIVSLANNHVFDYGREAMLDTTALLDDAGIPYVGGGRNLEEAKRPIYFIVNGIKIGFVGASNGEKLKFTPQATEDEPGILRAYDTTIYNQVIQEASRECDYLIAYIHWGTEDTNYFNADQQRWGREFLTSGADIVVGGHPHVLQGMEYVEGKPIIYSLGDFWFNHETKYTGVLKLNVTQEGLREMSFVPGLQTGFTTQYLEEAEEQEELYSFLEGLSPNIEIDEDGIIREK